MQTQVSSCCLPAFCCVQKNKNFLNTGIVHVSLLHYTQHHDSRWLLGTAKRRAGIREDRVHEVSGFKDVSQKKKKSQLFSRIQVILVCICIYQWVKIYESQGGVFYCMLIMDTLPWVKKQCLRLIQETLLESAIMWRLETSSLSPEKSYKTKQEKLQTESLFTSLTLLLTSWTILGRAAGRQHVLQADSSWQAVSTAANTTLSAKHESVISLQWSAFWG